MNRGATPGVCTERHRQAGSRGYRQQCIHGASPSTHTQAWGGPRCGGDPKETAGAGPGSDLVVATTALVALGKRRVWQGAVLGPRL